MLRLTSILDKGPTHSKNNSNQSKDIPMSELKRLVEEMESRRKTIPLSKILAMVKPFSEYKENAFGPTPDIGSFESVLDTGTCLGWSSEFNERVKVMPINTWICTDTEVGINAYYMDGEFIALSFQSARKNRVEYSWVSVEKAKEVAKFIRQIDGQDDEKTYPLIDANSYIDASWLEERSPQPRRNSSPRPA